MDVDGSNYGSIQAPLIDGSSHKHEAPDATFKAAVFGFSDGLTTNACLVIGMYGALTSSADLEGVVARIIIMTGVAGMLAGASSMACGEWLSAKAEAEAQKEELGHERKHLTEMYDTEASHMKIILMESGMSSATADAVNREVAQLPIEKQVAFHGKFELGIDVDELDESSLKSAAAMWFWFAVGAAIPLAPWLLTKNEQTAFVGTIVGTVLALVATSAYQVRWNLCSGWMARTTARQVLVVAAGIGVTVGLNILIVGSVAGA
jgi:VIT1/CCC1 family predicted Fe2+/Mn2+ transporter